LVTIISTGLLLPSVQSNSISSSMQTAFNIPTHYSAIALVTFVVLIISGGIKRISKFSEIIVPLMGGGYILLALIIVGLNIGQIPAMFQLIFKSAFGFESAFAGVIGAAISWGVKRGIYSNEA